MRLRSAAGALLWYAWLLDLTMALAAAVMLYRTYGPRRTGRFLAGFSGAALIRHAFLHWLTRRTAEETISLGDPLSLARFTGGNAIAGVVASGIRDRCGPAGRLAWSLALCGATALDWLDGPLARRSSATRHGAALDIEADSWLTLWCAVAAAAWGGLPRWVVLPPLVRYLHPLLDVRKSALPRGGGPGLGRVTGIAQMVLLLAALAPVRGRPPRATVRVIAALISGGRLVATLIQLGRRLGGSVSVGRPLYPRFDATATASAPWDAGKDTSWNAHWSRSRAGQAGWLIAVESA